MRLDSLKRKIKQILSRANDRLGEQGICRVAGTIVRMLGYYLTNRLGCYYYKRLRSHRQFSFQGQPYSYFYHSYNMSWRNERSVEIPIVLKTVSETSSGKILEVGNVLSHYFNFPHDIVDKYETANGLINQDIVDFQAEKKYDLIVSISTLEHVGWDEEIRDPAKILRAIENLKNCLAPGGKLIVTLPLGLNRYLDELLRNGKINFTIQGLLKRISKGNDWVETDWPTSEKMKYGCPFLWANALFVGIYQKSASTTRI